MLQIVHVGVLGGCGKTKIKNIGTVHDLEIVNCAHLHSYVCTS